MIHPPQLYQDAATERQRDLLARAATERLVPRNESPIVRASRRITGRALIALGNRLAGDSVAAAPSGPRPAVRPA